MYKITVKDKAGKADILNLETESRSHARSIILVFTENGFPAEATVLKPAVAKPVKFKGVETTPVEPEK